MPKRHREAYWPSCTVYEADAAKTDAYRAALSFAGKDGTAAGRIEQRELPRFCLVLMGDYGTGKTWLATTVFKHLLWNADRKVATWRKFYDFVRIVQSTYGNAATDTVRAVLKRYQTTPILLLDDVGDLTIDTQTDDRRRLLYEVLDKRNDEMLPTILTSNLSPKRFKKQFGERTLERVVEMAALYRMEGRNYRKKPITHA